MYTWLALFVSLDGSRIWPSQSSGHLPHISSLELSMIRLSCVKQYGFLLKENSLLTTAIIHHFLDAIGSLCLLLLVVSK